MEANKSLTWDIETNTSFWLQFNETNRIIYGTPHNRDVGTPFINLMVRDVDGDLEEHNFTLTIENTEPEILTENQVTVFEDSYYYMDYNSSDDDGYYNDTMVLIFPKENLTTWQHQTNASWLQFDNETGILNGTPKNNDVGTYSVKVIVDDGNGGQSSTSFTLTVINTPPEIITEDINFAYKNVEYYNDYNSSDDEFGNTTWELETNATWLFIDHEKGILSGTPGQNDVKTWWANITVTDDHGGKANRNFTILVIDLNSLLLTRINHIICNSTPRIKTHPWQTLVGSLDSIPMQLGLILILRRAYYLVRHKFDMVVIGFG